jgi:hypothetical protein
VATADGPVWKPFDGAAPMSLGPYDNGTIPQGNPFQARPFPQREPSTARVLEDFRAANRKERDFLHKINNPLLVNAGTTDCVSCHTAGNLLENITFPALDELPQEKLRFESGSRFSLPPGITGFVAVGSRQTDMGVTPRNFGRVGNRPAIAQRTANESAHLVDLINTNALHASKHGPGKDCSTKEAWDCFVHSAAVDVAPETQTCLDNCK